MERKPEPLRLFEDKMIVFQEMVPSQLRHPGPKETSPRGQSDLGARRESPVQCLSLPAHQGPTRKAPLGNGEILARGRLSDGDWAVRELRPQNRTNWRTCRVAGN